MKFPTEFEKENLQRLYIACRSLLIAKIGTNISVQKSFEEMLYGYLGEDSWRPTHITNDALKELSNCSTKNVQRAHGILQDRLDRYERTMSILKNNEKSFDEWWDIYIKNDATILLTRKEHSLNMKFLKEKLIEIPQNLNLFGSSGFSFKFRKRNELSWIKSELLKASTLSVLKEIDGKLIESNKAAI